MADLPLQNLLVWVFKGDKYANSLYEEMMEYYFLVLTRAVRNTQFSKILLLDINVRAGNFDDFEIIVMGTMARYHGRRRLPSGGAGPSSKYERQKLKISRYGQCQTL